MTVVWVILIKVPDLEQCARANDAIQCLSSTRSTEGGGVMATRRAPVLIRAQAAVYNIYRHFVRLTPDIMHLDDDQGWLIFFLCHSLVAAVQSAVVRSALRVFAKFRETDVAAIQQKRELLLCQRLCPS